jgi:hypothetical protein
MTQPAYSPVLRIKDAAAFRTALAERLDHEMPRRSGPVNVSNARLRELRAANAPAFVENVEHDVETEAMKMGVHAACESVRRAVEIAAKTTSKKQTWWRKLLKSPQERHMSPVELVKAIATASELWKDGVPAVTETLMGSSSDSRLHSIIPAALEQGWATTVDHLTGEIARRDPALADPKAMLAIVEAHPEVAPLSRGNYGELRGWAERLPDVRVTNHLARMATDVLEREETAIRGTLAEQAKNGNVVLVMPNNEEGPLSEWSVAELDLDGVVDFIVERDMSSLASSSSAVGYDRLLDALDVGHTDTGRRSTRETPETGVSI